MRGRWSKRAWLRAAAIAFLIAAAVVGRVSRSEWQSDDLLTAGMAFAAFADGWIGVLVALAVAPLALPMHSNLPASYRVGEWIEFITVGIAVTLANKVQILRRSDAKMRAVFASISDIILILDGDGTCIEMPPNNSLLSRPPEELIGRSISDIFPSDGADLFLSQIASVFASGKMVIIEYPLQIGERLVWFSASVAPLDESSVIWIARDITERKSIEDALEQRVRERTRELSESVEALHVSEERFRLLAWSTTEAVWDLDMATGEVWRGKGYETSFGYAEGQLEPTVAAWRELIHPDDRDRVQQSYTEAMESGELSWSGEYRFRRADGSYAHILHNAHIVRDDQKRAVRVLGALIDITERKQLAEELEQTKRVTSLGRIAASIAQEVNNVLMAIQPNAEVIHRRTPAELRHVTENIMQAVRRGKRVTEEILRFTRPAEPNLQCVEVAEFLEHWTEEIRPLLGGKVQLHIELPGTNVYALADPMQIGQVFTNLAINARDAMQDRGGTLRITAELAKSWGSFNFGVVKTPDRFVHFTVRDQGSGISTAQLPHIFEPLFSTKPGGVGLGLAITHQIVTQHDGHIFVESEVGAGSTFHIFIPNTIPAIATVEPKAQSMLGLRRLLLVEDEPAVASGIAMLMEMEGIEVETVFTGRETPAAIERFSPDAIILDIGLPDIDGVGLYSEIHERWPELPVLFSSGHADASNLDKYLSRPNVRFLRKPYDFDTIRATLAEIVPEPSHHVRT